MSARTEAGVDRSDSVVFAAARKRLDECPAVPGTVRVHVEDGVVTLTGSAQQPAQRIEAERVVRPVIGERRLINNIIVLPLTEDLDGLNNGR
jgi:osmotically-inducible protein OsmY